MATAAALRLYHLKHEKHSFHDGTWSRWAEKPSAKFPFHMDDGLHVFVSSTDLDMGTDILEGKRPDEALESDASDPR